MEVRPGIIIKKEEDSEILFIIDDSNVSWVRQGNTELFCTVPDSWVSEVVAITFQEHNQQTGEVKMIGMSAGKDRTGFREIYNPIKDAVNDIISAEQAAEKVNTGKIVYNGSIYKIVK